MDNRAGDRIWSVSHDAECFEESTEKGYTGSD